MKTLNLLTTMLVFMTVLLSGTANAVKPVIDTLTVQAYMKKVDGTAVTDGAYNIAYGVFKGGTAIWGTNATVTITNGLFVNDLSGLGTDLSAAVPVGTGTMRADWSATTLNTALLMTGATGDLMVRVYAITAVDGTNPQFDIALNSVPTAFVADQANSVTDSSILLASIAAASRTAAFTGTTSQLVVTNGSGLIDAALLAPVPTSNFSGTVAAGNGGTGNSAAFVQGGVSYGSSTSVMSMTAAGTAGQFLTSNGTGAPTWTNADALILNLTNMSALSGPAALTVASAAGSATTVGDNTSTSSLVLQSGSGGITIAPSVTGNFTAGGGSTSGTVTVGNASTGAATFGNSGAGAITTLQGGSGAAGQSIITSAGTGASAISITTTGAAGGISIVPNATGDLVAAGGATSGTVTIGNASTGDTTVGNTGAGSDTNVRSGSGLVGINNAAPEAALDVVGAGATASAIIVPRDTTANRPSTPVNGMIRYNTSTNAVESFENAAWKSVSPINLVVLSADVANSTTTIADVTGLSFAVISGVTYRFRATIIYTAAATTTGSRWSINGPATSLLSYSSRYGITATTATANYTNTYNIPAAANTGSPATTGNIAVIEGVLTPSANGTVIIRFASELASAITAKAGSTIEWW